MLSLLLLIPFAGALVLALDLIPDGRHWSGLA